MNSPLVEKPLRRQIPQYAVFLVIAIALLTAVGMEVKALKAHDRATIAHNQLNPAECIRCHSDKASLKKMRLKEDGANFLFNRDGSFKGPVTYHAKHPYPAGEAWKVK